MEILQVTKLNHKGEGLTSAGFSIPRALPGEKISFKSDSRINIIEPATNRISPICKHYKHCGGCSMQHVNAKFVKDWKSKVIINGLEARGLETTIRPMETSSKNSRRRANLHGLKQKKGVIVGFFRKGSEELVSTPSCELLHKEIMAAFNLYECLTTIGATRKSIIGIAVSLTDTGLDISVTKATTLNPETIIKISNMCKPYKVARLTWNDEVLCLYNLPIIQFDTTKVNPPPGAFLQATTHGEQVLIKSVTEALAGAKKVIDLFSGCGTFSFPAAKNAEVVSFDNIEAMINSLDIAWRNSSNLKKISCHTRDLFKRPVLKHELLSFDAAIIDPPRVGAERQTLEIADSKISRVAAISCNPITFSRDAEILTRGGFNLDWVQPVDQFLWSSHIELVAQFTR